MIARIIIPQTPKWFKTRKFYLDRIADQWGGYTYVEGIGGWLNDNAKVIRESVVIIDVYVPADTRLNRYWWTSFAKVIRVDLDQDCVYLQFSQADVQFVGENEDPPKKESDDKGESYSESCSKRWATICHGSENEKNDQPHHDIGGEG